MTDRLDTTDTPLTSRERRAVEAEQVRALARDGWPDAAIAVAVGKSERTVWQTRTRAGIPCSTLAPGARVDAAILDCYRRGLDRRQLAEALGIDRRSVSEIIRRRGMSNAFLGECKANQNRVLAEYLAGRAKGETVTGIAARLGVDRAHLTRVVSAMGGKPHEPQAHPARLAHLEKAAAAVEAHNRRMAEARDIAEARRREAARRARLKAKAERQRRAYAEEKAKRSPPKPEPLPRVFSWPPAVAGRCERAVARRMAAVASAEMAAWAKRERAA